MSCYKPREVLFSVAYSVKLKFLFLLLAVAKFRTRKGVHYELLTDNSAGFAFTRCDLEI